jgi:hypothetical protein
MGRVRIAASAASTVCCLMISLGGCAPISSPPSMPDPGGVPVRDVVQAIKCELLHAVIEPMQRDDTKWLQNYTAKIDLTLNVSTLNQLDPTVVFNNPLHNVYPNVGTSSLPGTSLSAVQQKFTFGVGGGVADSRARAEDMTFTVGLNDLRDDFATLSLTEPRFQACLNADASLDFSNLDIKSWMDRRVLPLVERINGYQVLKEGHAVQTPGTSGKTPPTVPSRANYAIQNDLPTARKAAHEAEALADYIANGVLPFAQKVGGKCAKKILEDSQSASDDAADARVQVKIVEKDMEDNGGQVTQTGENAVQAALRADSSARGRAEHAFTTAMDPKVCPPPPTPAVAKTPPFDTISANYTFAVAANIGVAPSWTLVRVTGPSGTGSMASTAGAWTNNVSIIMAPAVAANVNADVNNQRLIQSLRPPPLPPVAAPF